MTSANHYNKSRIISFRVNGLPPVVLQYLDCLSKKNQKNKFICEAINSYYFYTTNFKQFITQIIELNYGLVKHLLRKIGKKNG